MPNSREFVRKSPNFVERRSGREYSKKTKAVLVELQTLQLLAAVMSSAVQEQNGHNPGMKRKKGENNEKGEKHGTQSRPIEREIEVLESKLANAKRRRRAEDEEGACARSRHHSASILCIPLRLSGQGRKPPKALAKGFARGLQQKSKPREICKGKGGTEEGTVARSVLSAQSARASPGELDCDQPMSSQLLGWQQTYRAMREEELGGRSGEACDVAEDDSLRHVARMYMNCMREFAQTQIELTLATLSSHTVKGDKVQAQKVGTQYMAAGNYLLGGAGAALGSSKGGMYVTSSSLSLDSLKTAHKVLMRNLCVLPGEFRTVPARCGNRHFIPPAAIPSQMKEFVLALGFLLSRQDISICAKAAWALGHLVAIHPFADGNGRLARLLANWVLASCDLPFAVLCSADSQRAEIQACKSFDIEGRTKQLAHVISSGALQGWHEFDCVRDRAMRTGQQDASERCSIKHIKRTAKDGTCIVCQEQGPDIVTTCCAASYHITCLTKWLVSGHNSSCCKCRSEISYVPPRHPVRVVSGAARADAEGLAFLSEGQRSSRARALRASARNGFSRHQLARAEPHFHWSDSDDIDDEGQASHMQLVLPGSGEEEEGGSEVGEEDILSDSDHSVALYQFGAAGALPILFTDLVARSRHDDEETATTANPVLPYSSDDDEGAEEDQEEEANFPGGAGGLFERGVLAATSLLPHAQAVPISRRQPKCPRCQENQQASDCNFGACGQCCRELQRQERGQSRASALQVSSSQTCRRHPAA